MSLFRIKDRWRCPAKIQVKSVGGIIMNEDHCILRADHEGPHRGGKIGCIWDNNAKRMQNFEKAGDPIRKKVFIP
jgi:hypothetical protein